MEDSSSNKFDVRVALVKFGTWLIIFAVVVWVLYPIKNTIQDNLPSMLERAESLELGSFKYKIQKEAKMSGIDDFEKDLNILTNEDIKFLLTFGYRTWAIAVYEEDLNILYIQMVDNHEKIKTLSNLGYMRLDEELDLFISSLDDLGFIRTRTDPESWKYIAPEVLSDEDKARINSFSVTITDKGEDFINTVVDVVADELKVKPN